jgi:hypothetical protein
MTSPDEVARERSRRAADSNRRAARRPVIDWPTQIAKLRAMFDELELCRTPT